MATRQTSKGTGGTPAGETAPSRLVRFPKATNALRAIVDDKAREPRVMPESSRLFYHFIPTEKPSVSERSKPSNEAMRLLRMPAVTRVVSDPAPRRESIARIEAVEASSPERLGAICAMRRRMLGLSQGDLAARAGVGRRFLGELENGKPTIELGKALRVIQALDLILKVHDGG